ncbi:MAG TPA: sigma-70 family RNA polymerase sigma factor [Planctomycetota bacterium]|nr:sigma-70 family RNA polymerase sigma factor [Planctomycetota bacterium]
MTAPRRDIEPLLAHAAWVRNLALQLCADVHAAEDAAQDTWAAALRHPPRDPDRARGFLARTLHNALAMSERSERRRTRRERLAAPPAEATDVGAVELVARAELHRHLVVAVLALPEGWRELVLRHYFEGEDVAALARRTGISPDAVRAQLRRARERLRADLEGAGGEPARAFASLLASNPVAGGAAAGLGASVASVAGALTIMKVQVLLGGAVLVSALWLLLPLRTPPAPAVAGGAGDAAPAVATAVARGDAAPAHAMPVTRDAVPLPDVMANTELQGRLVGLHPDVPWTAPLALRARSSDVQHEHEVELPVTADGMFAATLPAWFARDESVELQLRARDAFYLPVDARFGLRALAQPIVVPVEPTGVVTGRVVDPRGIGVPAARVAAFLQPAESSRAAPAAAEVHMRCSTNTDAGGNYRLQVPLAAPLLLLAVPMHEASSGGRRMIGEGGAIADDDTHRDDLLPANQRVTTRWGRVAEVPELQLHEPAYVTGSVTTGEGAPLVGVEMIWIHDTADGPALYDVSLGNLMTWTDGSTGRIALTKTDANGRFRLPATPGKQGVCYPRDGQGRMEPFVAMVRATPPAESTFDLEGGIAVVRVLCGGMPVPGVKVLTDSIGDRLTPFERRRETDASGEVRFLRSTRASHDLRIQRPGGEDRRVELLPGTSATEPLVVELAPLPAAPVTLEFEAASRVRQVELTWRRLDAKVAPLRRCAFRNDGDGPFHVDVPSGRYELVVDAPSRAERRDTFLLRSTQEVEVPLRGCELTLPAAHGGRVRITMTERDGRYAHGRVGLTGSAGTFDWSTNLRAPEDSPNLPAGTYTLRVEQRNRTVHEDTIEVRTCEVTDVRIRLP